VRPVNSMLPVAVLQFVGLMADAPEMLGVGLITTATVFGAEAQAPVVAVAITV
jgi:hypothetical protein